MNRVQQVLRTEAATGPFDLLQLIGVGGTGHSPSRDAADPVLRAVHGGRLQPERRRLGRQPADRGRAAQRRGLLPRLAGWRLDFSGLADVSGRQPALPLPQRTHAHRATGWPSATPPGPRPAAPMTPSGPTRRPAAPTPVPVVPVPAVTSVAGPHHAAGLSVPADELFAFNSAQPAGRRGRHPRPAGQPGPRPAPARSPSPDTPRPTAVRPPTTWPCPGTGRWPSGTGWSRWACRPARSAQVTGLGTAGQPPRACDRHGQLDEAICAGLRRVVILLIPQSAAAS